MRRAFAASAAGLVTAATFLIAAAGPAPAQARRITLEDLGTIVRLSDPQISPDGRTIAVVVSRPNYDENKHESELVLVEIGTGAQRVLTRGRAKVSFPRWSPTGDRLAFLAIAAPKKKPAGAKAAATPAAAPAGGAPAGGPTGEPPAPAVADEPRLQIFVLPMNGGDALQVSEVPGGVQQFAWRPDGGALALVTEDEPADREAMKKGEDAFEVGDNDYMATEAPRPSHIWLVPAEGGAAQRLTSGSWSLPVSEPPGPPSSPLAWSPDGRMIAFAKQAGPHFGDGDQTAINVLEAATGAIRPLTGRATQESVPSWSPDGTQLAYWYNRDGDQNNVNEINLVPAAGGTPRVLSRELDRCLYRSIWMPDGKSILVGGNDKTRVSLWLQPLDGPARRLSIGKVNPAWSFWVDVNVGKGGAIVFTGSESQHPGELYYMPDPDAAPRRLTSFNDPVAALDLGKVEPIEWQGPDSFAEDGVIIYPPGFDPAKKYPLVLYIHGGPQAASTEGFSPFGQLLAAHDWVVFQPNYRGSDNLGNVYQRAIAGDAGDGPGRDVIAGIEALKTRGFVDAARIGVSGWSYGGYMTSWLIGHYDIWKAAVTGASVTDLSDQYNLSDFNVQERWIFAGRSPWVGDALKDYRAQSPITYAAQAKAPTLILSDTGDVRVPVTQSYRLYHALKDNGVETKFVAFPVGGHFPSDPVRARAVSRYWLDWFETHLGQAAPEPAPPDGVKQVPPGR
jgi:dipeptidyl aminopeptidase/acylaminoacyl peptidase